MQATNQAIQVGTSCWGGRAVSSLFKFILYFRISKSPTPQALVSSPSPSASSSCPVPPRQQLLLRLGKLFSRTCERRLFGIPMLSRYFLLLRMWMEEIQDSRCTVGSLGDSCCKGQSTRLTVTGKNNLFFKSSFLIRTLETLACRVGSRRGSANSGSWVKPTPPASFSSA